MKVGFVSIPLSGHLNPMITLARRLQSRGHEVVFIGVPDVEPFARVAGLDFVPFCENEYPEGSLAKGWDGVSKIEGLDVMRYSCNELMPDLVKAALENLPEKLRQTCVEALALDTMRLFYELVPRTVPRAFIGATH
jgi:zeaxanthin glucosyltransferase